MAGHDVGQHPGAVVQLDAQAQPNAEQLPRALAASLSARRAAL